MYAWALEAETPSAINTRAKRQRIMGSSSDVGSVVGARYGSAEPRIEIGRSSRIAASEPTICRLEIRNGIVWRRQQSAPAGKGKGRVLQLQADDTRAADSAV